MSFTFLVVGDLYTSSSILSWMTHKGFFSAVQAVFLALRTYVMLSRIIDKKRPRYCCCRFSFHGFRALRR